MFLHIVRMLQDVMFCFAPQNYRNFKHRVVDSTVILAPFSSKLAHFWCLEEFQTWIYRVHLCNTDETFLSQEVPGDFRAYLHPPVHGFLMFGYGVNLFAQVILQ